MQMAFWGFWAGVLCSVLASMMRLLFLGALRSSVGVCGVAAGKPPSTCDASAWMACVAVWLESPGRCCLSAKHVVVYVCFVCPCVEAMVASLVVSTGGD